jgi:hypothetical protein
VGFPHIRRQWGIAGLSRRRAAGWSHTESHDRCLSASVRNGWPTGVRLPLICKGSRATLDRTGSTAHRLRGQVGPVAPTPATGRPARALRPTRTRRSAGHKGREPRGFRRGRYVQLRIKNPMNSAGLCAAFARRAWSSRGRGSSTAHNADDGDHAGGRGASGDDRRSAVSAPVRADWSQAPTLISNA